MKSKKRDRNRHITVYISPFGFLQYCVVKSDRELKRLCKANDIDVALFDVLTQGQARCEILEKHGMKPLCIVRMPHDSKNHSLSAQLALLVHECNHIKRELIERMNEKEPSAEFECYVLQEIFENLSNEYLIKPKRD